MIDVNDTLKQLLEEADTWRDKLEQDQNELKDLFGLFGVKLDDVNAGIIELEGQYDEIRAVMDTAAAHAEYLGETLESIGYHALLREAEQKTA